MPLDFPNSPVNNDTYFSNGVLYRYNSTKGIWVIVDGFANVISTDNVIEGGNLYFTTARARNSISAGSGITYNSNTGVITADVDLSTTNLSVFAATTSAGLASVITDEIGTGNLVLSNNTTLFTPTIYGPNITELRLNTGNVLYPSIAFTNKPAVGIYNEGGNSLTVSINGVKKANVDENGLTVVGSLYPSNYVYGSSGAQGTPTFSFLTDTNTGIYNVAADQLGFTAGGGNRLTISTTQFTGTLPWRGQDGTAAAPAMSFSADTDVGVYRETTNVLAFAIGGAKEANINSNGLHVLDNVYAQRYFGDGSSLTGVSAGSGAEIYYSANTTYDGQGRVTGFRVGNFIVSNIVYSVIDTYLIPFANLGARVSNVITSFTQQSVGSASKNVTIQYVGNSISNVIVS